MTTDVILTGEIVHKFGDDYVVLSVTLVSETLLAKRFHDSYPGNLANTYDPSCIGEIVEDFLCSARDWGVIVEVKADIPALIEHLRTQPTPAQRWLAANA